MPFYGSLAQRRRPSCRWLPQHAVRIPSGKRNPTFNQTPRPVCSASDTEASVTDRGASGIPVLGASSGYQRVPGMHACRCITGLVGFDIRRCSGALAACVLKLYPGEWYGQHLGGLRLRMHAPARVWRSHACRRACGQW